MFCRVTNHWSRLPPPFVAVLCYVPQSHPRITRCMLICGIIPVVKVGLAQMQTVLQLLVISPHQKLSLLTGSIQFVSSPIRVDCESIIAFLKQEIRLFLNQPAFTIELLLFLRGSRRTNVSLQITIPNSCLVIVPEAIPALILWRTREGSPCAMPNKRRHMYEFGRIAVAIALQGRHGTFFHFLGDRAIRRILGVFAVLTSFWRGHG
mmetsp:Transcript_24513/g.51994  ORF Transcript_24513/g.51994 Transcript_24513/m.51994 type:complete len:207 (-) Transcript_24513:280-900(-)